MFKLTDRNIDIYTWNGAEIELNLAFDNVLLLLEMFEDEELDIATKLDIALDMLVCDKEILYQLVEHGRIQEFTIDLLRDAIGIDLFANREEENPSILTYDFVEDAERIYSSFFYDYKIDLFEQQGKLHWQRFLALFRNLSHKSPQGQAMHYRTCEVPKKDKHNADERKRIIKLKEHYQLKKAKAMIEAQKLKEFEENLKKMKKTVQSRG